MVAFEICSPFVVLPWDLTTSQMKQRRGRPSNIPSRDRFEMKILFALDSTQSIHCDSDYDFDGASDGALPQRGLSR